MQMIQAIPARIHKTPWHWHLLLCCAGTIAVYQPAGIFFRTPKNCLSLLELWKERRHLLEVNIAYRNIFDLLNHLGSWKRSGEGLLQKSSWVSLQNFLSICGGELVHQWDFLRSCFQCHVIKEKHSDKPVPTDTRNEVGRRDWVWPLCMQKHLGLYLKPAWGQSGGGSTCHGEHCRS